MITYKQPPPPDPVRPTLNPRPIKVGAYLNLRKDDIRRSCEKTGYSRAADVERADGLNELAEQEGYALRRPITADSLSVWRSQNNMVSCRRARMARVAAPVRRNVFSRLFAWIGLVR